MALNSVHTCATVKPWTLKRMRHVQCCSSGRPRRGVSRTLWVIQYSQSVEADPYAAFPTTPSVLELLLIVAIQVFFPLIQGKPSSHHSEEEKLSQTSAC